MKLTTERLKQIIREEIQGLEEKIRLRRGPPPEPSPVAFHRRDDGTMVPGRKADKVSNPNFKGIKFPGPKKKKKMSPSTGPEMSGNQQAELERLKGMSDEEMYAMYVQQMKEEEVDEAINLRTGPKPDIKFRKDPKTGKMVPAGKKIRRNPFGTTDAEEREAKRLAFSGKKTTSPDKDAIRGPTASSSKEPEEPKEPKEPKKVRRSSIGMTDAEKEYSGETEADKRRALNLEERIFKMLVAKINGASK